MAWSTEQESIFKIWVGRVPLSLLASFVGKSSGAVEQKAFRLCVSVAFTGRGANRLGDHALVERLILSGELTNSQITKKLGLKRHYVATVKRRMKKKTPVRRRPDTRLNNKLLNTIFR